MRNKMKKYLIGIFILSFILIWSIYVDRPIKGVEVSNKTEIIDLAPEVIPYTEENLELIKSLNFFTIHNKITSTNDDGSFTVSLYEYVTEHYINPEPYALSESSCEVLPVTTVYRGYNNKSPQIIREYQISTDTPLALSVKKRLENDTKNIALCKEKKQLELTETLKQVLETLKQTCSKPIKQITLEDYKQCKENNLIK